MLNQALFQINLKMNIHMNCCRTRYPPYTDTKLKILLSIMAKRPGIPGIKYLPYLITFGLGVAVSFGFKAMMKVHKGPR